MSALKDPKFDMLDTLYKIKALGELLNEATGHKLDISDGALCSISQMIYEMAGEAIAEMDGGESEKETAA